LLKLIKLIPYLIVLSTLCLQCLALIGHASLLRHRGTEFESFVSMALNLINAITSAYLVIFLSIPMLVPNADVLRRIIPLWLNKRKREFDRRLRERMPSMKDVDGSEFDTFLAFSAAKQIGIQSAREAAEITEGETIKDEDWEESGDRWKRAWKLVKD
jgi:hypothetical protein